MLIYERYIKCTIFLWILIAFGWSFELYFGKDMENVKNIKWEIITVFVESMTIFAKSGNVIILSIIRSEQISVKKRL